MGILGQYLNSLKGKRIAVLGAGISNTPLIDVLLSAGIDTTVRDKRSLDELGDSILGFKDKGAMFKLGEDYLYGLNEDIIFRTPGLMPTNPAVNEAVKNGAMLTSEMEAFFDICPCKTIAVTGSDGKTTTTSIIAKLLENEGKTVHTGGNIGTPLLCRVDEMKPDDIAVIELSSFQLITMEKSPNIAVVTNLSPNHLDVHTDMEEYIFAKSNIFMHQGRSDRAVFNIDNELTFDYSKTAPAGEILFFSRHGPVKNGMFLKDGMIYESVDDKITEMMKADEITLPGIHNVENYLAAFTAVTGIVSHDMMRKTAVDFQGVEHRIEFVRELRGIRYYNDSIASSPSRAIAGIRALSKPETERRIILVAGGKDKGIAFDDFGDEVVKQVKTLVLTGAAVDMIFKSVTQTDGYNEAVESHGFKTVKCDDFEKAVITASKLAEEGDTVLLSPACTSFDKFRNFEERGNVFKDIINRLV